MKHLKRIFVLLLCSLFLFVPTRTNAQEIFDITNYSVNIQMNEDGRLNIHEVIDLDFMDYAHGFYRNIPIKYEMDFGNGKQIYYFPVKDIQVNSHLYKSLYHEYKHRYDDIYLLTSLYLKLFYFLHYVY